MTHLTPSVDPKDDYQRYAEGAKKFFSGSVLLAKDLMQF
jgi:ribonuclease BN (tRNA processing enzyme)